MQGVIGGHLPRSGAGATGLGMRCTATQRLGSLLIRFGAICAWSGQLDLERAVVSRGDVAARHSVDRLQHLL